MDWGSAKCTYPFSGDTRVPKCRLIVAAMLDLQNLRELGRGAGRGRGKGKKLLLPFPPTSFSFQTNSQPRPQGLILVQNGGRRNPSPRLLKYSKNRGVFCHVTHDEMAFSEVVSSVWRPCLFSAIENCCSNETKSIYRIYATKF